MESVFDKWACLTRDFGLIQCPVEQVTGAYLDWADESDLKLARHTLHGSLEEKFAALPPLTMAMNRALYMPTGCGWTAVFKNGIRGSDPSFNMRKLAVRTDVVAMRVCCAPPDALYPAVIWEVYAPPRLGGRRWGYRRAIAASNDGGRWVFSDKGERFPFEAVERYAARRIRDRFTREMLVEYLGHFGIPEPGDQLLNAAIDQPSIMLEREGVVKLPEFTLEEVNQGLPWRRKDGMSR